MGLRTDLHDILKGILGSGHVYYQPPETVKLSYPCIRYEKAPGDQRHADNQLYSYRSRYNITLITRDPDSDLVWKLLELPMCRYDRHFTADNLYHDVFELYF